VKPTRPALSYFGSKWRLAPWIISHFPPHTCYVEPFCGSASLFLRKPPAEFEVINDIDGEVTNFFRVLRNKGDELIRAILATPYSRAEFDEARIPVEDTLERARRYYIQAWQGWSGFGSPWRYQKRHHGGKSVINDWNAVEHLPAIIWRLKKAQIENADALEIVERYDQPRTLFYIDPPYLPETRSKRWRHGGYRYEFDEDCHQQLLARLQEIQGMAIISGYPSELYERQLAHWRRVETRARTTNTANLGTEVIWLSPSVNKRGQLLLIPSHIRAVRTFKSEEVPAL